MGSGGDNRAQRAAEQQEQQRQAQINQNISQIDSIFSSPQREAQYADFLDAARSTFNQDLSRQKADNDRDMRFALARSGQTGGSLEIDKSRRGEEVFQRGVIDAERLAQGAVTNVRQSDQDTRQRLSSMATTGADMTTAAQQAALSMQNNLQSGRAAVNVNELGNVFGSMADGYQRSVRQSEERRGRRDYGLNYQPGPWASGYKMPGG